MGQHRRVDRPHHGPAHEERPRAPDPDELARALDADRPRGQAEAPERSAEYVFDPRPVQSKSFFNAAVERAQAALREAGKDISRLEGYVWHGNRHTFASRLVMAGVDLRTVQELGGWRSLAMVQKYGHLAPGHQLAAVEALVRGPELA